jgi:hypothetical protein
MAYRFPGSNPASPRNPPDPPDFTSTHCYIHPASATKEELAINRRFLWAIQFMIRNTHPDHYPQIFGIIKDFLVRVRARPRRDIDASYGLMDALHIRLDDLLVHVPLDSWPLPDRRQCPVAFCKDPVDIEHLEEHLHQNHRDLWSKGQFHSEFHTTIASLFGMELQTGDPQLFTCPIPRCTNEYFHLPDLTRHIYEAHSESFKELYENLGGFWSIITLLLTDSPSNNLDFIQFPTIDELFKDDQGNIIFSPYPVPRDRAQELWASNVTLDTQDFPPLPNSPLDSLLRDYLTYVSEEGVRKRYKKTFEKMSKTETPNNAKHSTIKRENQKTTSWLNRQRQFTPASFPEVRPLSRFIIALIQQSFPDEHNPQESESSPPQSLDNNQTTEEENQHAENGRQWIHRFLTEQQENPEPLIVEEIFHVSSQDDHLEILTDVLEHDNHAEEDRSLPRSSPLETPPQVIQPSSLGPFTTLIHPETNAHENIIQNPDLQFSTTHAERANRLLSIFHTTNPGEIESELESFLSDLAANPIPEADRIPLSLDTPILLALVQSKAHRICRKQIFCPFEDCHTELSTTQMLSNHLHNKHDISHKKCADIVQFFISQMFERDLKTTLITINEREEEEPVHSSESLERCYLPQCKTMHSNHKYLNQHMKNPEHIRLKTSTDLLGWFWGIISLNTKNNSFLTIKDMLKECEAFQCQSNKCHRHILSTEQGIRSHFSTQHRNRDRVEWRAPYKKVIIKTIMPESENINVQVPRDHSNQETNQETNQEANREVNTSDPVQLFLSTRRRPHKQGILCPTHTQVTDSEAENIQEANDQLTTVRRLYIQKRANLLSLVQSGVNLPPLTMKDKRKLVFPLKDLFKSEINPLLEEMLPKSDDWDSWLAFEGVYEDALDKIRKLIIHVKGRDVRRLYGTRKINVPLQIAREKVTDEMIVHQTTQRQLRKIKMFLQEIAESAPNDEQNHQSSEAETNRRLLEWTKKIVPLLNAIKPEKRTEVFGDDTSFQNVWEMLNTSSDHRQRVINWLETLIISELEGELEGMAKVINAQMIRQDYNLAKGITIRRHINKQYSPPCSIDKDQIHQFFQKSWSTPPRSFQEATSNEPFFLQKLIPDSASTIMEQYMLNEDHITEVIMSRADIGACGPDGIGNSILKAAGKDGIKFMKHIVQGCISTGRIFDSWKNAKTILIHKKGDRSDLHNWRPISITNCLYRDFTCLMARCFQRINEEFQLFSNHQKGFIQKTNGCTEHGIILNELFHDARRNNKELVITAIDFTNAFGSVPHELILSTMKQRNFPEWTRSIVQDMYTNASSYIEVRGDKSQPISWKVGVKQGCPLSPLLFNLCIEPLIQSIKSINKGMGAYVDICENKRIENLVQAYADDVALISEKPEGIQAMLKTLEAFTKWAKMEINVSKCTTASYLFDPQHHRCSLSECFKFNNQDIPNLTLLQSMKYLGTAVAARRNVKLHATSYKFHEMKSLVQKILNSPLLIVQKIDAIKTFVIPCFDFLLLNGDLSRTQLKNIDSYIRGEVNKMLKIPSLPKETHHMSWKDGGFSIPSLLNRSYVLSICSFAHMSLSKDPNIRSMTRAFIESERRFRRISSENDTNTQFLNWKNDEDGAGTASFINNARRAVKSLNAHIHFTQHELTIGNSEKEIKTHSPRKIGEFLTQKIIRPALAKKMIAHPDKGASFPTLENSKWSNKFLRNTYSQRSNAFYRFAVASRTNSLPTMANIHKWYPNEDIDDTCHRCNLEQKATLAHILNGCTHNFPLMTDRHNRVARCVKRSIETLIPGDLSGQIYENTPIQIEGLSDDSKNLRPDMWFYRREDEVEILEILEFSCPYGYIKDNECTLLTCFEKKSRKYQSLASECSNLSGKPTRFHPIIISSLGAVHKESLKCLKMLLGCDKNYLNKLGTWMSEHAIMGSFKLWIDLQKKSEHLHNKNEELEEINLANQENIEELDNENAVEIDEEDQNNTEMSITRSSDTVERAAEHDTNSPIALGLQIIDSIIAEQSDSENETSAN